MIEEDKAWTEYREKFAEIYDESNYSSPLQATLMCKSHQLLEKPYDQRSHFEQVLEVGAGTGEHLPFIRHTFNQYTLTDLDPKTLEVAQKKLTKKYSDKVSFEVQTGSQLTCPNNTYDRLVATHVLEHIYQPHLVLKEWRRVLKHGATLSILIPTDPGIAWRLGRHMGPRKSAIAQGISYDYVMAREHVNPCNNLIALLRHYFPKSKETWWPLPIPSIDLNLFFAFHTTIDKKGENQ